MKKTKTKRIVSIVAIVLAVLLIGGSVGLYCLAVSIYDGSFNYRCTTDEEISFDISEFPTLTRERHTFTSDKGQTLVGYLYEQADPEIREKEEHSRSGLLSFEDTLPVCIYLPAGDYETLSVSSASGDVKTSAGLGFQEAEIETSSGDIRLESLEAETLSAKTDSGKVKLRGCSAASLTLESGSGDQTVKETACSGDGKLHSGSGDIELEDSSFRALDLSTTSGKTTLSKTVCSGSVKAESGSGDIRLRKASAASFDFRSTSGNVKGSVVGSVDFIVESSSGSVRTRGGVRGAAACRVRTGSGDVDLEIDG